MPTSAPLPLALERARADKKLVVFAGAVVVAGLEGVQPDAVR